MKRFIYTCLLMPLSMLTISRCDDHDVVKKETKLDYYLEWFEIDGLDFEPQLKVTYEYDEFGRLTRYLVQGYNPDVDDIEELRHFEFSYTNDKVDDIKAYLANAASPYLEYSYQYLPNGDVLKIAEQNHSAGVNSEASFTYTDNGVVNVSYVYSNGGSFAYEFDYTGKNILRDKTTRGTQLCSDGQYTYDQHHNPFKDLGYVDYTLTNLSVNNKLTESVNYVGCALPTLVPESYSYEYNDRGYPLSATTFYKSQSTLKKSTKKFFYK